MKIIAEHIKRQEFKPVYLLSGSEEYLKIQYKERLKKAILGGTDEMNYSYYEGSGIDASKVMAMADTLPFFSEKRLIMIEDSGWFKSSNDFADYLKSMPQTTHIIFVEKEVDKRNRLYKAVKELGHIAECEMVDEAMLIRWIRSRFSENGKKISDGDIRHLISKTGSNMENISTEMEKVICYALDQEIVTSKEIDAVCVTQLSNKIFDMVNAIGSQNQSLALKLYYDLLALKEKPMTILYLVTRQINLIMQVKEMMSLRMDNATIAKKAGVPPFTVSKYAAQARNFTTNTLCDALKTATDIEESVKTGRLIDKVGVELLIVQYSQK